MSTKKQEMCVVFGTMLTMVLLALSCFATEGETVSLQGFVSVLRDANDVIIAVQLDTDTDIYNVVLDAKGQELGDQMEDQEVKVKGVVSEKEYQKWLKVLTFEAVEEEEQEV